MRCPRCHAENSDTQRFCGECGSSLRGHVADSHALPTKTIAVPVSPARPGELLAGKYRIIDELGRGGMGVVLRAEDTRLKRTVALKFLSQELTGNPEARERFIQEARAASALEHPNICTIHEIDEAPDGRMFMSMACYEGESLRERLKRGKLEPAEALSIALQVARGLARAHEKGIVHRDIKPGNIFLADDGQAKILDFGLAKLAFDIHLTRTGATLGTLAYMSPEQAEGKPIDHRTDIWSLGVVLYEMLAGRLPFEGDREASLLYSIVHKGPRLIKGVKPPVSSELQRIIKRALEKNPKARYQSAVEILNDLEKYLDIQKKTFLRRIREPRVAIPFAAAMIGLIAGFGWLFNRQAKIRWARTTALPEIRRLIDSGEAHYGEAYALALKAERYIAKDPGLIESLSRCGMKITIATEPPGAKIFMQEYRFPDRGWNYLGVSPIERTRVPFGFFRWRFEKPGYVTVLVVHATFDWDLGELDLMVPAKIFKALDKDGTVPAGMVRVAGGDSGDFFMDEHEVTNQEFKKFIDDGGYQRKELWKHPFFRDGRSLAWEEALGEFVDSTGMPGPSNWEGGNYPQGKGDYPASGISWYEAAAYAEYMGKSLPTVRQWEMGAGLNIPTIIAGEFFLPLLAEASQFGGEGPVSVKTRQGITAFGAFDMAGNVREWCGDETKKGKALRGGAWNDSTYMFHHVSQSPPFDRSLKNGVRCVLDPSSKEFADNEDQPISYVEARNYLEEKPVPDAVFGVYKEQFSYDEAELLPSLEARDESHNDWIKEKISFNAAYDNERMSIYLFLPKAAAPPFQTVIVFPGSQAVFLSTSDGFEYSEYFRSFCEFIIRSGRALVYPIYKGTYERGNPPAYLPIHFGNGTRRYSDFLIALIKDFRRSIDYLETRDDIDVQRISYCGFSWGAVYGAIIPAVEERLAASVLWSGGFPCPISRPERVRPEVDELNYVTRVRIPTLMLNGIYDYHAFPLETSSRPMFVLLGTPQGDKQQIVYDSDHTLPKSEYIRDTLNWLDRYLGPVKRRE